MHIKTSRSVESLVDDQVGRWHASKTSGPERKRLPVLCLSRQTGTHARLVARKVAEDMKMDLSGKEILNKVAADAKMRDAVVHTLDEKKRSFLDDLIASWQVKNNLTSDEFFKYLVKTIGTVGEHGNHVIVGRGANFIIKPPQSLRVRFVASIEFRIASVQKEFNLDANKAKDWVISHDGERKAYIRKYFNADIDKSDNYDLVINSEFITVDEAAVMIESVLKSRWPK